MENPSTEGRVGGGEAKNEGVTPITHDNHNNREAKNEGVTPITITNNAITRGSGLEEG
jgi:hypothetical protein